VHIAWFFFRPLKISVLEKKRNAWWNRQLSCDCAQNLEVAASSSMVRMFIWKFVKPLGFETLLVMLVSMSNDVQAF
jgi:hypothetical protein